MPADPTLNEYLEKQRALARERKRRSRERKSNGHVTNMTPGQIRAARVVKHIVEEGMSKAAALRTEGFHPQSTAMLEQIKAPLRAACRERGLTPHRLVASVDESLNATSPMLTAQGCIERPDWAARAAGRRDAIQLLDRAGELPAVQASGGGAGPGIQVTEVHYSVTNVTQNVVRDVTDNAPEPLDVVVEDGITQCQAQSGS